MSQALKRPHLTLDLVPTCFRAYAAPIACMVRTL